MDLLVNTFLLQIPIILVIPQSCNLMLVTNLVTYFEKHDSMKQRKPNKTYSIFWHLRHLPESWQHERNDRRFGRCMINRSHLAESSAKWMLLPNTTVKAAVTINYIMVTVTEIQVTGISDTLWRLYLCVWWRCSCSHCNSTPTNDTPRQTFVSGLTE